MRSVAVVLPASMWAMMPMLRVFAREVCRAISQLPAVVRERAVRFRHPVYVFALLDGAAPEVRGVHEFVRQLLLHRLAVAALACEADEPPDAQRQAAVRV